MKEKHMNNITVKFFTFHNKLVKYLYGQKLSEF